mgnify:CR=1 FL=1
MENRVISAWIKLESVIQKENLETEKGVEFRLQSAKPQNHRRIQTATGINPMKSVAPAVRIKTAKVMTSEFSEKVAEFSQNFVSTLFKETQKFGFDDQNMDSNASNMRYRFFLEKLLKKSTPTELDLSDFGLFSSVAPSVLKYLQSNRVEKINLAQNPLGDEGVGMLVEGFGQLEEVDSPVESFFCRSY